MTVFQGSHWWRSRTTLEKTLLVLCTLLILCTFIQIIIIQTRSISIPVVISHPQVTNGKFIIEVETDNL